MDIQIDNVILNYLINEPWISNVVFVAINILIYGLNGFLGGFLPEKVTIANHTFYTLRKDAYNSERLTRIVQHRYYNGETLTDDVRKEILDKYGPQKLGAHPGNEKKKTSIFTSHYKDVQINKEYYSKIV